MMLYQIDDIGLQAAQGLFQLPRGLLACAAIDLGHQECLLPVTIPEGFAHAAFTLAVVVIPAVVEEIHAAVEGAAHNTDAERLVHAGNGEMPPSYSDAGDFFPCASEVAIRHLRTAIGLRHASLPG